MLLCTAALAVAIGAPPASAQDRAVKIDVIEVSGLLDPINVDFMTTSLVEAQRDQVAALVIRLDSPRAVTSVQELAGRIRRSSVPVAIWVGPGRQARVGGSAAAVFSAASIRGVAPGAKAGGAEAIEAATLGDFIVKLADHGVDVPTKVVERDGRPPQQELAAGAQVRFDEPSLLAQLLHAVATPSAAYLLLVIGLLLVVFEFFTAGVGVAGAVGAAGVVLGGYGLGVLPTRPLALAVLVVGILGYAIDVQAGAPRAWSVIGTAAFVAGSFFLFGGGLSVPLVVLAIGVAGVALFMVAGMPAMVRTRFSTPTIGRESMLGEEGLARTDVAPDGVVTVRDAPWRARTNRATPIRAGETIRVAAIDGLLLEVEPLEGAAKDAGH